MATIETLWAGMITADSGTDSSIVLIINEPSAPADVVQFTFPDTGQSDQEANQANLYEIKEEDFAQRGGRVFDHLKLNLSSIRLAIRGSDQWEVGSFFVWGEARDGLIVPLGLVTGRQSGPGVLSSFILSTDVDEARVSVPIPRVQLGSSLIIIRRMMMLLSTADEEDAGTDDLINLKITTIDGRVVVDHDFKDTLQDDLEQGEANFYFVPVDITFNLPELNDESIVLSIKGKDAWLPDRLFLFGLSDAEDKELVEFVVPVVHLPRWNLGTLSKDPDEGRESVPLPLVDTPAIPPTPTGPIL
jgi:hypothetical protein